MTIERRLCVSCQADPDPRGWTACAACRALNSGHMCWSQTLYPAPGVVIEEIVTPGVEFEPVPESQWVSYDHPPLPAEIARAFGVPADDHPGKDRKVRPMTIPTVRYCPVNHHDTRGIIRDIFPDSAPEAVTLITQRAGTVRGNHLHKLSTQHLYVVSGGIVAYHTAPYDMSSLDAIGMGAGAMITHPPGAAHAYRAVVDSVLLAFAEGVRKGADYDKDTYKLVESLLDLWDAAQVRRAHEQHVNTELGERLPPMLVVGDPW